MKTVRKLFFNLIDDTRDGAVWILLTKRPENVSRMYHPAAKSAWLLASASTQARHDERIWHLAENAKQFRGTGWSIEPQLGPVRLKAVCLECRKMANWLERYCSKCRIGGMGHDGKPFFITCDAALCDDHAQPISRGFICSRSRAAKCHHFTTDLCPVHLPWGGVFPPDRAALKPIGPGEANAIRAEVEAAL